MKPNVLLRPGFAGLAATVLWCTVGLLYAGCVYSMYGYHHAITYSAHTDEARAALKKKVEVENALRDVPGVQYRKQADVDSVQLAVESKGRTSPEFGELRKKIESALGPELLKQLRTSKDWWPIP